MDRFYLLFFTLYIFLERSSNFDVLLDDILNMSLRGLRLVQNSLINGNLHPGFPLVIQLFYLGFVLLPRQYQLLLQVFLFVGMISVWLFLFHLVLSTHLAHLSTCVASLPLTLLLALPLVALHFDKLNFQLAAPVVKVLFDLFKFKLHIKYFLLVMQLQIIFHFPRGHRIGVNPRQIESVSAFWSRPICLGFAFDSSVHCIRSRPRFVVRELFYLYLLLVDDVIGPFQNFLYFFFTGVALTFQNGFVLRVLWMQLLNCLQELSDFFGHQQVRVLLILIRHLWIYMIIILFIFGSHGL